MCFGSSQPSSPPPPPPLQPAPPAPPKPPEPAPAPEAIQSEDYTPQVATKKSKKEASQQVSKGTSQLKISSVNTGGSKGGLNV